MASIYHMPLHLEMIFWNATWRKHVQTQGEYVTHRDQRREPIPEPWRCEGREIACLATYGRP